MSWKRLVPKLNLISIVLPLPTYATTKEIEKLWLRSIWNGKPDIMKRKLITRNYPEDGISVGWVFHSHDKSNFENLFMMNTSPKHADFYLYNKASISNNSSASKTNEFCSDVLKWWAQYSKIKEKLFKTQCETVDGIMLT